MALERDLLRRESHDFEERYFEEHEVEEHEVEEHAERRAHWHGVVIAVFSRLHGSFVEYAAWAILTSRFILFDLVLGRFERSKNCVC